MSLTLLQFDFPSDGPWGPAFSAAYAELAQNIATAPGLIWKVWTENAQTHEAGGIYMFADAESAAAYQQLHTQRLRSFGITHINVKTFTVNESLSKVTFAPLARQAAQP